MKVIKPNDKKFKTEWVASSFLALICAVLFVLNALKIDIFVKHTVNTRVLFGILLAVLFVYFLFHVVTNIFYKITITESFISFYFPVFTYNKKVPLTSVTKCYMERTQLIVLLSTNEIIKVGVKKYSKSQHKEIVKEISQYIT